MKSLIIKILMVIIMVKKENNYEKILKEVSDYDDWINEQISDEITTMLNDSITELKRNLKTIDYTDLVITLNNVESLIILINDGDDDENGIQELIRQFVLFHYQRIKLNDKLNNFASEIEKTEELILDYVNYNSGYYFSYVEIGFDPYSFIK